MNLNLKKILPKWKGTNKGPENTASDEFRQHFTEEQQIRFQVYANQYNITFDDAVLCLANSALDKSLDCMRVD